MDPVSEVAAFVRDLQSLRGYRRLALRHAVGFFRHYRKVLNAAQMAVALVNLPLLCLYSWTTAPGLSSLFGRRTRRTYVSSTESLDWLYEPVLPVAPQYTHYFQPTMLTNEAGQLAKPLADDLLKCRDTARPPRAVVAWITDPTIVSQIRSN